MKKTIVCFGDSNTWGYDTKTNARFPGEIRWTKVLQKILGADYDILEEGLCGRTTVFDDPLNEGLAGINYILPCLQTKSPIDTLIIMLGTNDCKQRFSATAKNIADGMKRLVIKAKQATVWKNEPDIIIVSPAHILKECEAGMFAGEMGICADTSTKLAKEYEIIANEQKCRFYDAQQVCTMNDLDFMHLTKESHAKLAKALAELLTQNK